MVLQDDEGNCIFIALSKVVQAKITDSSIKLFMDNTTSICLKQDIDDIGTHTSNTYYVSKTALEGVANKLCKLD